MTPDEYTIQELHLEVGEGHKLYVQDWGKKDAKHPILFLHGGPGAPISDRYKQRFVPTAERVLFFEQRGVGKSMPAGSLENNTTAHLIEDINKIAAHFQLEKFILVGGSWGSCLALSYAIKYPQHVKAMVLNSIFTGRKQEIEYLDQGRFRAHFPDVWERYQMTVPEKHRDNPSAYHYKHLAGNDKEKAKRAAYSYGEFLEGPLLSLDDRYSRTSYQDFDPAAMRIEMHYLMNQCFLPEGYIMDNAHKLTMPVRLIQGRYDMVCPPATAYELSKKIPDCQLIWTVAGHGNERSNYDVNRAVILQLAAQS